MTSAPRGDPVVFTSVTSCNLRPQAEERDRTIFRRRGAEMRTWSSGPRVLRQEQKSNGKAPPSEAEASMGAPREPG